MILLHKKGKNWLNTYFCVKKSLHSRTHNANFMQIKKAIKILKNEKLAFFNAPI